MIFKIRSFLALALALSSLDVTVSALSVPVDYRDSVKKVPIDYSVKNGTFYYISGYNSNKTSCGDKVSETDLVAALPRNAFTNISICNMMINVTIANVSANIMVVDRYPEAGPATNPTDIYLSLPALRVLLQLGRDEYPVNTVTSDSASYEGRWNFIQEVQGLI